jgi:subtilase family serine protease
MAGLVAVTAVVIAPGAPARRSARKVIEGTVPQYAKAGAEVADARGSVDFSVALGWRHARALSRFDRAVSNPGSPTYGHYLSPARFRARYSPRRAQVANVKRWLIRHGFDVTDVSTSRMLVSAAGTAGQVDRAFHTSLRVFKADGQRLRAPANSVSVPAKLSGDVVGIAGLAEEPAVPLGISADTAPGAPPPPAFRNAPPCSHYWSRKIAKKMPDAYGKTRPWATCGYRPHQLEGAYGVRGAIRHGNDGSGQSVAIIDAFAAPTILKDVNIYSRRHGLPPVKLKQKVFHGCHHACDRENRQGWYGEETLDLEAVHLMAPGARIRYVGAADSTFALVRALGWAVDHRVAHIITNSYGHIGEAVSKIHIRVEERIHQEAIAEGIGIYFSSGDDGDESHVIGYPATDYPASSPKVTAVGGTTLAVGPRNNYRFETGWGTHVTGKSGTSWDPAPPGGFLYGSGGGTTRLFSEPGYQKGVVPKKLAQRFGGHGRVVPDISMDGDPNSGMLEGESQTFPNGKRRYGEYRIGGTSLSSPLFAGYMALADQKASFHHGFLNPASYELAGGRAIRDIRRARSKIAVVRRDYNNGVNKKDGTSVTLRTADMDTSLHTRRGYDDVTGIGAPRGAHLLNALRHR